MSNNAQFTLPTAILAAQAVTTNGTSAAISIPLASSYRFTVELLTASSTTTNFNVAIFASSDNGTVYHGILGFTALTTSGQCISAIIRPFLSAGEVATVTGVLPVLGATDFASNVNVVNNGPFDTRFIKVRWQAATTGTVSWNLKLDAVPLGADD